MDVQFHSIRIGDRSRRASAWLVMHEGAVRGILSTGTDAEVVLAVACDRRIQTEQPVVFRDMVEARAWLAQKLRARRRPLFARSTFGPRHEDDEGIP